jgi:hypothetical protein
LINEAGNEMADDAATRGMNGKDRHVMPVAEYVNDLLGRMGWREGEADATRDPTVMDAISEAEANALVVGCPTLMDVIGEAETNVRAAPA